MFCLSTLSPRISVQLAKGYDAKAKMYMDINDLAYAGGYLTRGYGGFHGAYRTRATLLTALEHVMVYINLLNQYSKDLKAVVIKNDAEDL